MQVVLGLPVSGTQISSALALVWSSMLNSHYMLGYIHVILKYCFCLGFIQKELKLFTQKLSHNAYKSMASRDDWEVYIETLQFKPKANANASEIPAHVNHM